MTYFKSGVENGESALRARWFFSLAKEIDLPRWRPKKISFGQCGFAKSDSKKCSFHLHKSLTNTSRNISSVILLFFQFKNAAIRLILLNQLQNVFNISGQGYESNRISSFDLFTRVAK